MLESVTHFENSNVSKLKFEAFENSKQLIRALDVSQLDCKFLYMLIYTTLMTSLKRN